MVRKDDQELKPGPIEPDEPKGILITFTADPANILPFGTSILKWKVERIGGGAGALTVKLGSETVKSEGQQVVRPDNTTLYTITADAPVNPHNSKSVTVNIDTAACVLGLLDDTVMKNEANKVRDELLGFLEGPFLPRGDVDVIVGNPNATILIKVPLSLIIGTPPSQRPIWT